MALLLVPSAFVAVLKQYWLGFGWLISFPGLIKAAFALV